MSERRRIKHTQSLADRVNAFAESAREQARLLLPGPEKDALLMKARQADAASRIDQWASSPGLQPPK
jgi:hypothetical protein